MPTAQNSFLPVAGATGSHYLTWMMLKQFSLRGKRWFSKKKPLEPAPQPRTLRLQLVSCHAETKTSGIVGHAAAIHFRSHLKRLKFRMLF